ncbi:UNVERIFIED_CONTAM: hypothetical protein FKN15_026778 [Acipenser sinensis]
MPVTNKYMGACAEAAQPSQPEPNEDPVQPLAEARDEGASGDRGVGESPGDSEIVKSPSDPKHYRYIKLDNGLQALLISDLRGTDGKPSDSEEEEGNSEEDSSGEEEVEEVEEEDGDSGEGTEEESEHEEDEQHKSNLEYIKLDNGLQALLISDLRGTDGKPSDSEEEEGDSEEDSSGEEEVAEEDGDSGEGTEEESEHEEDEQDSDFEELEDESDVKKKSCSEKQSAAALCVGIGGFSDPDDLPGLAHFLEHMVFMGSEKYPAENGFDAFLKKHGGSDNASTDCERTVFQFDVQRKYFREALDRWAQFFISPLMIKDAIGREVEAVDSEYQLARPSDSHRKEMLFGSLAKPGHPMGKFCWGNAQTLKHEPKEKNIDIYARLREFWEQHYSAHYMTLAVQSKETLDTLEEWVREIFSKIPNNSLPKPDFSHLVDPFDTPAFNKLYRVVPVRKIHALTITWALLPQEHHYRCWALALYGGNSETGFDQNSTYSIFSISITLTDEGYRNYYQVISAALNLLVPDKANLLLLSPNNEGSCPLKEKWFGTQYSVQEIEKEWSERWSGDFELNPDLHLPAENKFIGDLVLFDIFVNILAHNLAEPAYEADVAQLEYKLVAGEHGFVIKVKGFNHKLPLLFNLIIDYLADFTAAPDVFSMINEQLKKTYFNILIKPDKLGKDARLLILEHSRWSMIQKYQAIMKGLSVESLMSFVGKLKSQLYAEGMVQGNFTSREAMEFLHYVIQIYDEIQKIEDNEFHYQEQLLFNLIIDYLADFTAAPDVFSMINEQLKKTYFNILIKPDKLGKDARLLILEHSRWSMIQKYQAIMKGLSVESLMSFVGKLKSQLYAEGMVQGNFTSREAMEFLHYVIQKLQFQRLSVEVPVHFRVVELPKVPHLCKVKSLNKGDANSEVTVYYQSGPRNLREHTLMELLVVSEISRERLGVPGLAGEQLVDLEVSLLCHAKLVSYSRC